MRYLSKSICIWVSVFLCGQFSVFSQSTEELKSKIAELQLQLDNAKQTLASANDTGPSKINIGDFKIGGTIRANYAIGDYATGAGPTRGAKGGDVSLDVFRINVDYSKDALMGKFEYRWYNGYNMLHTGWLGWQSEDGWQLQVGVNRVPFGPTAYGVSNSWFFDQHFYVGLADDMDLGIKFSNTVGKISYDLAYYYSDEGNWMGASRDSARYSYDPVVWDYQGEPRGYGERNQFNARAIASISDSTDLGASLQFGQLMGVESEDGNMVAVSAHMKNAFGQWGIKSQFTYYNYDIGAGATGDDDLIPFGAYDYAWPIATEAFVPAISINYLITTDSIDWLDSVNLYVEYSSIIKTGKTALGEDFKNSDLAVIGAAWSRGGWYIYTDLGFSNGNYFVGLDDFTTQGANLDASWQTRFNINFGYYF